MASHYKLYDGLNEVVPFSARYTYPTQANRAWKQNIKIPTTNGQKFYPGGSNPQITLPAQGYLNTRNTFVSFDMTITGTDATHNIHFLNNIQSAFNRMQLRYGSLSLEDLRETGPLTRILTDHATTNFQGIVDQTSVTEGIGGCFPVAQVGEKPPTTTTIPGGDDADPDSIATLAAGSLWMANTRVHMVQANNLNTSAMPQGAAGIYDGTRRYQFQLPFGLFQQNKLLPLKWMASQLTVELSLANVQNCMSSEGPLTAASYEITNLVLNAELMEFDGSYDAAFLEGLRGDGVPIKFASWDTFIYTPSGGESQTLQIPERNRSLKAAFCVMTPPATTGSTAKRCWDSNALLQSGTGVSPTADKYGEGHVVDYQWRIGGKYYPSQPVTCGSRTKSNGAAEAYLELQKALNIVGDYRLSTSITPARWCRFNGTSGLCVSSPFDWSTDQGAIGGSTGDELGPSSFVIALDMETSAGAEVSGLNGEEQNDISLVVNYSSSQPQNCRYLVYIYYDALLVLRENNLVELIK